ncbi:molybdate ABC transporter substrate-binding protein [Aeromicrobium phragmitis]|uniref:Molybdate ABC transporter substrate-binding protein n=1 Tax=Aeromicrobium phragmitis TaxID=2478914 RepID=A0A3L8PNJ4_9ACTN|nr:molybdate ABC transporter substrate-binding protein [Aeromicrobium phragmitis]RLV56965.1 molybdate ABC transporter substrate-binding protein [Aeromicrobium phragmitis]
MRRPVLAVLLLVLAATSACAESAETERRTLTVFAAASLTDVFEDIAADFEAEHPGVDVQLSFAGSSDLAQQIVEGAPADVFAAADERTMTTVVEAELAEEPERFATNRLTIAVPAGNPAGIERLADLSRPDVTTVLCAPQVPCGALSAQLLARAGVPARPASEESSVSGVLTAVSEGQADAGLVYVTDIARGGDRVAAVDPKTSSAEDIVRYPAAVLADTEHPDLAAAFVDFIVTGPGAERLRTAGFGAP